MPDQNQTMPEPLRFRITFDGEALTGTWALSSVQDIDRFVKVLNAQRGAMEPLPDPPTTPARAGEE